jgi:hypothetical protein
MLFTDGEAMGWLFLWFVLFLVIIYGPLFWLYYGLCHLRSSTAIRLAWTVGLLGFLVFVVALSGQHVAYFLLGGSGMGVINTAILTLILLGILVVVWITKPRTV